MVTEKVGYESPLAVIYNTKYGNLSDLEKELGRSTVRQLEAIGFIRVGLSYIGDTWSISEKARHLAELRSKPYTLKCRLSDFYKYKLPQMLFGV